MCNIIKNNFDLIVTIYAFLNHVFNIVIHSEAL